MDKKDFLEIMQELNVVYGEKRFPLTKQVLDVWNKYLGVYSKNAIKKAVECHVRHNPFPPTVADILISANAFKREEAEKAAEIENIFRNISAIYPGVYPVGEADRLAFIASVGGDVEKASKAFCKIDEKVTEMEMSNEKDIPPLSEVLKGIES